MSIITTLLLVVEVISALLLIVVILAQKSKDQGLGMAFGGGMGESLFGSRAGNVLTRMTITLTVVFLASRASDYVNGADIKVDGGFSTVL